MKSISFFSDDIVLRAHTATAAHHVGALVSLRMFAGQERTKLYQLENGDYLAQTPAGRFIEGPEVRQEASGSSADPVERQVCTLPGGDKLSVRVHSNGWCALYEGKPIAVSELPKVYHGMVKAVARDVAYEQGYYTFKVPGPLATTWTKTDWINYVTFDFPI